MSKPRIPTPAPWRSAPGPVTGPLRIGAPRAAAAAPDVAVPAAAGPAGVSRSGRHLGVDGLSSVVVRRPVRPDDEPALAAFYGRLSPTAIARRFHAAHSRVPPEFVAGTAAADGVRRQALVAAVGDAIVAVAEWVVGPSPAAVPDVAVVVEDGWQRAGLGTALLRELLDRAVAAGHRAVQLEIQPDNTAALRLVASVAPDRRARLDGSTVLVDVDLVGAARAA